MTVNFADYGQQRDVDATPEELAIFEAIRACNDSVQLVRRSDKYVSASIGETDVARFKYTSRAKWIEFPYTAGKIKLADLSDVDGLGNEIVAAVEKAIKINNY